MYVLIETRFHHVGQASLELLASSDLPASASPSAEITGMSHCTRPTCLYGRIFYIFGHIYLIMGLLGQMVILVFVFVFLRWSFAVVTQTGVQWHDLSSTTTSTSWVQAILLPQPPE